MTVLGKSQIDDFVYSCQKASEIPFLFFLVLMNNIDRNWPASEKLCMYALQCNSVSNLFRISFGHLKELVILLS